jgi:competence protein ComEC
VSSEPADLRLAVGALAAWLAVVACLHATPAAVLIFALASAAVGGALLYAARRWRASAALALMLFCVSLVLLPLAGRLAEGRASPLLALAQSRASVIMTGTVQSDPVPLAATGVAGSPRVIVETTADGVAVSGRSVAVSGTVLVLGDAGGWADVLPGQRVRLDGTLQPDLGGSALSVTLFSWDPPELLGRPPWWQRAAGRIRAGLRDAARVLPAQERGLLPGLVDGDTDGLDPVLADRFRLAGLTHLVAVSGTNCSIVVGAALLVLRRLRARPAVCAAVGIALVGMFVIVARPSPSVLRAALMAAVALFALSAGRPRAGLPALAAAVLALLVWQPTLAGGASFTMSVLASAALLLLAPGWAAALRRWRVPLGAAEAVAVAAAAHVVTAPIIAAISGRISVVAIPANVLAEPVVAPVTVLGFAAATVAPVWPVVATALVWIAGWPCRWLVRVADFFGGLHGATVPWPGGMSGGVLLAATIAVVAVVACRTGPRRVLTAAAVTAFVILLPVRAATSSWPPGQWLFVACDVGQGDAELLPAGPGAAVLIDTGPDPVPVDRCLRDFGVTQIPLLVITHFHLDHVGGFAGAVRGRHIGQIISSPLAEPASGVAIVRGIAEPRGLTVRTPPVGTQLDIGAVHLEVLAAQSFHGTRSDPNNSSLVLRAVVDGVRILLCGDVEIEAQQAMLDAGTDLRADVLKSPHHGSAYFVPAFLAAVHARVAIVSVGANNPYGQPSPLLLTEMDRLGVPLLRTDWDGDVAVVGSPGHLTVIKHGLAGSTMGLGRRPTAADPPVVSSVSQPDAWMAPCRRAPSPSTTCRSRFPSSSSSSVTRSCWSTAASARSPPQRAAPTRRWPRRT